MASASARTDTQAPFSTKLAACPACAALSRVMSLTRTLASMARIALAHVPLNPLFHLIDCPGFRRPLREQLPMDILRRELARAPHDNVSARFVPLQNRPDRKSTRLNSKSL